MAKVKEKKIREKFNWKKELKLAPFPRKSVGLHKTIIQR